MSEPWEHHPDELTLHAYLDGELEADARVRLEAHLARCAACGARLAELETLFATIEALPDVPLERDLAPAVVAALEGERAAAAPRLRWLLAFQVAAALALLFLAWPALGAWAAAVWPGGDALRHLAARGAEALVAAGALGEFSGAVARALPVPALSPAAWGVLLAGAALLWLVGNGLLLRRPGDRRQRRTA